MRDEEGWNDTRPWYNDRIIETIISSESEDYHGEVVNREAIYRVLPFLAQHGIYNYWHTNFPIGEIIGWKINEKGLPVIRVGIHDTRHSNIMQHDEVWDEIKSYGLKGQSSIEGVSNMMNTGGGKPDTIQDMGLWAVAWVADGAANPDANLTYVNDMAKRAKGITKVPNNKGEIVTIQALVKGGENKMAEEKKPVAPDVVKEFPPKEDEEETKPEEQKPEEAPAEEAPADAPPAEETPAEEVPEEKAEEPPMPQSPAEEVPGGLAQQMAELRDKVAMLASALELLRSGTPAAIADTADAAEIISETIEQENLTQQVAQNVPAESSEIIQMKKELEQLKAENAEYKDRLGVVMEKSEESVPEAKPEVEEKLPVSPALQRRSVPRPRTVEVPGFNVNEMLEAANTGKQSEYFREKFKIDRKQSR